MKKMIALVSFLALAATSVYAGVPLSGTNHWNTDLDSPRTGTLGSVHDMRQYGGAANVDLGGNDRVCAFCHTPHHAAEVGVGGFLAGDYLPLWSRNRSMTNFNPFVSSTLQIIGLNGTPGTGYDVDIAEGPSRLCMGCHDGSFAVDQHYGAAGTGVQLNAADGFNQAGIASSAGGGLTNDHPIGFLYNAVAGASCGVNSATAPYVLDAIADTDTVDGWICQADATLQFIRDPLLTPVRVVDRLYNGAIMTCATCHDVHNTKNADQTLVAGPEGLTGTAVKNYLVLAPQQDSALCLSCHIK